MNLDSVPVNRLLFFLACALVLFSVSNVWLGFKLVERSQIARDLVAVRCGVPVYNWSLPANLTVNYSRFASQG